MNLRVYLVTIVLTWATAFSGFTLIKHGFVVLALLVLLSYWCIVISIAFKVEKFDNAPPFRFVGSRDKPHDSSEEWE